MPPGFELYKLEILCPNCGQRLELCGAVHGNLPHFAGADVVFSGTAETQRLPLDGKVPNAVRRMRWDAHHCFNLAAVQRTAGKHKGKTTFAAITPLHAKDATSSVGFRRQLPLEGKPNPRQKAAPHAQKRRKSSPLSKMRGRSSGAFSFFVLGLACPPGAFIGSSCQTAPPARRSVRWRPGQPLRRSRRRPCAPE